MSNSIIISDTSCLIAFQRIKKLELLQKVFDKIFVTEEVAEEFNQSLPEWIAIKKITDQAQFNKLSKFLDKGEASAITLALEIKDSLLIIDERKGRKIAEQLGIQIIGTLRILLFAKEKNIISSVKEVITELQQSEIRFSTAIIKEILSLAGEQ